MDPAAATPTWRYPRFPRPRGDGPLPRRTKWTKQKVSPPTRGWTRACNGHPGARQGFPAHAGMDREPEKGTAHVVRFPRPRGDGPLTIVSGVTPPAVSPPTRGWTRHHEGRPTLIGGFPAHAGMDPVGLNPLAVATGFPRPRGDGPCAASDPCANSRVSPPTRGWTPDPSGPVRDHHGFPAHAGMDPWGLVRASWCRRFPRPRGDGPQAEALLEPVAGAVSPPTRGWTRDRRSGRADMSWFPRPRGDGPRSADVVKRGDGLRRLRDEGFPAHAGMDLRRGGRKMPVGGFPRPRGDGPDSDTVVSHRHAPGFPRPRGDGPSC